MLGTWCQKWCCFKEH